MSIISHRWSGKCHNPPYPLNSPGSVAVLIIEATLELAALYISVCTSGRILPFFPMVRMYVGRGQTRGFLLPRVTGEVTPASETQAAV